MAPATPEGVAAAETTGVRDHAAPVISHNILGQKLGRKGRDTRERIIAACAGLVAEGEPLSLSAVARRAGLGLTSLYNYFTDLTELLLAVLEPVMATAEESYVAMLRERWPDESLGECCMAFMDAYFGFWARNSRLLHLRNAMADSLDERMTRQRIRATQPLILLFIAQMDSDPAQTRTPQAAMATVLMTGIERTVTVSTDPRLLSFFGTERVRPERDYLVAEARIMELAIRDIRSRPAPGA